MKASRFARSFAIASFSCLSLSCVQYTRMTPLFVVLSITRWFEQLMESPPLLWFRPPGPPSASAARYANPW
jgi:hypothetical protein